MTRRGIDARASSFESSIDELEASHAGHHEIDDDEPRLVLFAVKSVEGLDTVRRPRGRITFLLEDGPHHLSNLAVILDDQNCA